jgi:hypothetical protein
VNRVLALFAAHNKEDVLIPLVARALFFVSLGLEAGPHVPQITALLASVAPQSPEGVLLFLAVSRTAARELFEPALSRHMRELFAKRLPSLFCAGLRLLQRSLQPDIPEGRVRAMLKQVMPKLIECAPRFGQLPSIAEISGGVWLTVLTELCFKPFRSQTVAVFEALMPAASSGAFPAMAPCLPHFLAHALGDRQLGEVQRQIAARLPTLLVSPVSILLLKTYVKTAVARGTDLATVATSWAGRSPPDGYHFSESITEILTHLEKSGGFDAVLNFLRDKLLLDGVRFFPVFVAILRLRRSIGDSKLPRLTADLTKIGAALSCRAHGRALEMLSDRSRTTVALGLSQFNVDCEETAILLGDAPGDAECEDDFEPLTGHFSSESGALFERISGVDVDWAEAITPLPPSVLSPPGEEAEPACVRMGVSVGLGDFEPILGAPSFGASGDFEPITPHGHLILEALTEFDPVWEGAPVPAEEDDFEAIPEGELIANEPPDHTAGL